MGAGAFGSALAIALSRDGSDVTLWARSSEQVAALRETREVARLPGVILPKELRITSDAGALGAPIRLLAIPIDRKSVV